MKRIFDLFSCLIILFVLILPSLIICILIKIDSKGSIFFVTERVGKDKKIFKMFKFRTMKSETPQIHSNDLEYPEKYITTVGKYLRRYSLDELPQLINVITGDMTIVGPRPSLSNQIELIDKRDIYNIHDLKPGITGLAQVNGRDDLSIDEKIHFDKEYRSKANLFFDFKIIIRTIKVVLNKKGISH